MNQLKSILILCLLGLVLIQWSCKSEGSASSEKEEKETPKIAPPERQEVSELPQKFIDQLLGSWSLETGNQMIRIVEEWEEDPEGIIIGTVTTYTNDKEQVSKFIRIFEQEGKIYYDDYMNQNQRGKGTLYPLVYVGENEFSFEVETKEFPQIITYQFPASNVLRLTHKGVFNKEVREQRYEYNRK